MKPIGPNFRRFVSPSDPGDVVVRRRGARREDEGKTDVSGAKALQVSNEQPDGDWLRKRTLHHYPREATGLKLGKWAFAIVCVLGGVLMAAMAMRSGFFVEWLGTILFLGMGVAHLLGILSQISTGGRCWHGAVAMAGSWLCLFVYILAGWRL